MADMGERPRPLTEVVKTEPFNNLVTSLRRRVYTEMLTPLEPAQDPAHYIPNILLMSTIADRMSELSNDAFQSVFPVINQVTDDVLLYERPLRTDFFRGLIGIHSAMGRRQGFMDATTGREPPQPILKNGVDFNAIKTAVGNQAREYASTLRGETIFIDLYLLSGVPAVANLYDLRQRIGGLPPHEFEEATQLAHSITATLGQTNRDIKAGYFGELARLHFAIGRRQGFSDATIYGRTPSTQ